MPVFHEQALRAAAGGKDLSWLRPEHLADWPGLAAALDRLCPKHRCDAIYADWLLQRNSPARQAFAVAKSEDAQRRVRTRLSKHEMKRLGDDS